VLTDGNGISSTACLIKADDADAGTLHSVLKKDDTRLRPCPRTQCKPPKSMYIDYNDLMLAVSAQPPENTVNLVELQVAALKRQVINVFTVVPQC